ncbi:MAG: sugar ABC transporter permease [Spirochaetia bacterium]|jgi:raffinose/stachyose/melibiose transport system permease protein|uniref:Putative starch degradation products transport system permease protein AmyD n=1 Tax=uncultured spirochete TaxID=156406 RepID=A0A3P3XLM9_9SPIR|nr:sugar ABC transporter permease [Rectinema subterraneum]MDQ7795585.1 sugar ABC transporter permease [Spirochaetia bacterium]SLM15647.1 putative starch degradation products transport system permease protein AmyD [uncultured spirochete]HBE46613.1 ABC transporter permease [Spirochaetaceae bacterium]HCX97195.1 ABC transporter permease [Spirochaetaceae bacterium]
MTKKTESSLVFWVFLAPVLFAFIMVMVIPFFLGSYYAFTNWSSSARVDGGLRFVGLQNFAESFRDPAFLYSFGITFAYTILNMIAINVVAFALALLVTGELRLKNVYRVGFFVPNLIGGLILGYIWQFIFNNAIPSLGRIIPVLGFLANPGNLMLSKNTSALAAMIVVGTWQYAGYIMMIYVAAIENIPQELLEAAKIDGATPWIRLKSITIPLCAQAFTVTMFLTLVNSFKQFDVNVSLTSGGPSTMLMGQPILGTELLALNIYNTAFISNKLSVAQARAFVFFFVLAIISIIQVYVNKKREIEL